MTATKTTKKKAVGKKASASDARNKTTGKTASRKKGSEKNASIKKPSVESPVNPGQRYFMIQDAAYYIAENSGFNGSTIEHWVQAEIQIDNHLNGSDS